MNKKKQLKSHKIFVLAAMLADELDGEAQTDEAKEIRDLSRELQTKLDPIVDSVFSESKLANKTTYVQEIQNKLDTIIRKNFQTDSR